MLLQHTIMQNDKGFMSLTTFWVRLSNANFTHLQLIYFYDPNLLQLIFSFIWLKCLITCNILLQKDFFLCFAVKHPVQDGYGKFIVSFIL